MHDPPVPVESPRPAARHFVIGWLCSAAAIAYIHRNALGPAESEVRLDLGIDLDRMGWALSSFFWSYAVFQIPCGWLADRCGTRRLLSVLAFVWSLATAAIAFAGGFKSLLAVRIVSGAAQAGIFSCATRSIAHWFPGNERGLASGLLGSFMSVGGAIGAMAMGILLPHLQWRSILVLFALPGLLWSIGFYIRFRDRPGQGEPNGDGVDRSEECVSPNVARENARVDHKSVWWSLVSSPVMWWLGAQQFFRAAGYIFFASWFATFLTKTRDVATEQAAILNGFPLWAVVIGSPLGGIVSDWVLARTASPRIARSGVAAASMFGCALFVVLSAPVRDVRLAVLLISAGSFLSSLGGPSAYALTIDVGGNRVGTVFSVMNMCGNVGAAVFPLMVPQIVRFASSWEPVLYSFAILYVLAGVCWLLVNPRQAIFPAAG